jgi:hypothetical protein
MINQMWPFSILSTLLYTWQYFDMVETAANPKSTRCGYWLRSAVVTVAILGTITTTIMYNFCNALVVWYSIPGVGHLNPNLAKHY